MELLIFIGFLLILAPIAAALWLGFLIYFLYQAMVEARINRLYQDRYEDF
jgi:hypothetical protein